MKILKHILFVCLLFYISNILVWFAYNRGVMIDLTNNLSNNSIAIDKGYNYKTLVENTDKNIYNPGFNLGYGLGTNRQLLPVSIIIGIYIFYVIRKRRLLKK